MKQLLIDLGACREARLWAEDKSWPEIFETCHRGDWLLWLFKRTNHGDLRLLTLAKGKCAETVKHIMKDDRSKKAIEVAIDFGNGNCEIEDLNAAAAAAYAAYADAYADVYARKENQLLIANIVRQTIPIEKWNISC